MDKTFHSNKKYRVSIPSYHVREGKYSYASSSPTKTGRRKTTCMLHMQEFVQDSDDHHRYIRYPDGNGQFKAYLDSHISTDLRNRVNWTTASTHIIACM